MRAKSNVFSVSYYFKSVRVLFLQYVNDTERARSWLESKGISWTHYVVYDRYTRKELEVVYNQFYPIYSMLFYKDSRLVYKLRNVWEYSDGIDYAVKRGVFFDYVNVYSFFDRSFVERLYF